MKNKAEYVAVVGSIRAFKDWVDDKLATENPPKYTVNKTQLILVVGTKIYQNIREPEQLRGTEYKAVMSLRSMMPDHEWTPRMDQAVEAAKTRIK